MSDASSGDWEVQTARVGVVAGCVIKKDGKYLLIQEKQAKVYGQWNLPAGHVDKGETIEEAAIREAKEESGYEVELLEKVGIYHEDASKPVKHFYAAKIIGGELRLQVDEILDAQWLTYDEIQKLNSQGKLRAACVWEAITQVEEGGSAL